MLFGERRVVDDLPEAFAALVMERAPASVALSGGNTARQCYEHLAARGPDWSEVVVFFGDERWVPVADPDSNEGMARWSLLSRTGVGTVCSMREAGATIEAAAEAYDTLLAGFGPVSLVHLGMGPDGHTASLFPGSPALDEAARLVVATGDDLHPQARLTWTFPAIATSDLVVITVDGIEKRDALRRVEAGEDLPVARVRGREVIWLIGSDALDRGRRAACAAPRWADDGRA